MRKNWLIAAGMVVAFLLMSACIIAVVDHPGEGYLPPTEEFYDVFSFDNGGTLSLKAINGNIEIKGWDEEKVEVYAEKMIVLPQERKVRIYSKRGLMPEIKIDKFEDFIKIRTDASSSTSEAGRVDYSLNVPQSLDLKNVTARRGNIVVSDLYGEVYVKLDEGDISVDNFSGSLTTKVNKGNISTSLMDIREEDEVVLSTERGDIEVYLQKDVNAHIKASAPHGEISSEFELSELLPAQEITVELGEGGAVLSLNASNGDIRIKEMDVDQ
jgi:hypothetical protein